MGVIKMKGSFKILVFLVAMLTMTTSFVKAETIAEDGNDYPVVLVHGNGGWGRDEKNGFLYWGGDVDIQEELRARGYEVYTGVVGPFSSNWDRACELYAYIKGGTVDYGLAHSQKFGHDRYGRTYTGLYPNWGNDDEGVINKIHLIGHSQGGQTIRVLVQLLEEEMQEEIDAVVGVNATDEQIKLAVEQGQLSSLFTGSGKNWVESVSTFATPNDGTTLADAANLAAGDLIGLFATPLGGITGLSNQINYIDLKLDQWGLTRNEGELFSSYFYRVMNSPLWKKTKDFSNYDLSTKGSREMNMWVKDQPNIYYFSYSCLATKEAALTLIGQHVPDYNYMNPLFTPNSLIMGSYFNLCEGIDRNYFPNDGYVNTICQNGPKLGRDSINIITYNGNAVKGVWNHMGLLDKTDHEDIIGRDTSNQMGDLIDFYSNYIDMLQALN